MKKTIILSMGVLLVIFILVNLIKYAGYGFSIQASSSMPRGLYFVMPANNIHRGDVVIFKPPREARVFLLKKHWVPKNGLLMKTVFAMSGDFICKKNHAIWINHKRICFVFNDYAPYKKLLDTRFCGMLKNGQYLLMSTRVKRSFDGRYFGPVNKSVIVGVAKKL